MRILIAEDDLTSRAMLATVLDKAPNRLIRESFWHVSRSVADS